MPNFSDIIAGARDSIGVKRVYGEPYQKNGVTIIPAAQVMGGAGGGEGTAPVPAGEGEADATRPATGPGGMGGGFGVSGRPAGAFVIKGDSVTWLPAVDVNRMLFGFQVVMIVFFLVIRSIVKTRANAKVAAAKAAK